MARLTLMHRLARWHIWLGWIISLPILMWTVTGLFMALRPIDEVRGTDLLAERSALPEDFRFAMPDVNGWPVMKMTLLQRVDGPVWVIERADGSVLTSHAQTGEQIQGIDEALARKIADRALKTPARKARVRKFEPDSNPLDLRRGRRAWQVSYDDGTNVYVDADSGEILAVRTRWWRFYDVMWGLHIMDPVGREDTSNMWLWLFGSLALIGSLFGTILLFRRRMARR